MRDLCSELIQHSKYFKRFLTEFYHCENCINYIGDVIVYGNTEEKHDVWLGKLLKVFKNNNTLLNEAKWLWKGTLLKFLVHQLSDKEIDADHKSLEVIFKPIYKPPAKIEHWALRLQSFSFKVIYQPVGEFNIADSAQKYDFKPIRSWNIRCISTINNNSWKAAGKNPFLPYRLLRGTKITSFLKTTSSSTSQTWVSWKVEAKSSHMTRHRFPEGPWQCLAVDLMGRYLTKNML